MLIIPVSHRALEDHLEVVNVVLNKERIENREIGSRSPEIAPELSGVGAEDLLNGLAFAVALVAEHRSDLCLALERKELLDVGARQKIFLSRADGADGIFI